MIQADCVYITPRTSTSRRQNIHEQEAVRQAALGTVRRLRREAAAEIKRLIDYMDQSDDYVMTEREPSLTGFSDSMDDRVGDDCDLEDQHDAEVDRSDSEPRLAGADGQWRRSRRLAGHGAWLMSDRKPTLPVNTHLHDAIAAHQEALTHGDDELGHMPLRSVIMAKTATVGDLQRFLDYRPDCRLQRGRQTDVCRPTFEK